MILGITVNCLELPVRGPSGPFRRTVHDTSVNLGQELCKFQIFYYELSEGEKSTIWYQEWTVWPLGVDHPPVENHKNTKVPSLVKFILASSRTVRGAWSDHPRLLYLTSNDVFNALIAVDIAIIAECCDSSRWYAGADRPAHGCGPSTCGRKDGNG
jgi:hypothetical protein